MSTDVSTLSLEQLAQVRKQFEAEIDNLSDSSMKLRQALARFMDCANSVKSASEQSKTNDEILVPLTASLYVPGKIADNNSFVVDVGTNYFIEKDGPGAVKFFNEKVESLNQNIIDLDKLLGEKVATLSNIDTVFKLKYAEAQKESKAGQPAAK